MQLSVAILAALLSSATAAPLVKFEPAKEQRRQALPPSLFRRPARTLTAA